MAKPDVISPKPADSYRILHTADWHLGKMLNDQTREEEQQRFLDWLLENVKQHRVDAILLAGDVFDTANPPQSAVQQYFNFVSALFRQGTCALVAIAGNHDSAAQLEAPKQVLQALNVHVVGFLAEKPETRLLRLPNEKAPKVAIAMLPFLRDRDLRMGKAGESDDEIRNQIVAGIQQRYAETADAVTAAPPPCPVLATGHLTVVGAKTSDSERDIHIGGLGAVKPDSFPAAFAYVALGHLHRPQATDGAGRVRYAGSPMPLSFSEAGDAKEVRILDVSPAGIAQQSLPIPVFRRLLQVQTTLAGLEAALAGITTEPGALRTWVEVVVEDATLQDDLSESVRKLSEGRDFEVLKVVRGIALTLGGMSVGEATDEEAIDKLLDDPGHVFEHLLQSYKIVEGPEVDQLKTTFARLVELESHAGQGQAS